jgi:hypothetical protein
MPNQAVGCGQAAEAPDVHVGAGCSRIIVDNLSVQPAVLLQKSFEVF